MHTRRPGAHSGASTPQYSPLSSDAKRRHSRRVSLPLVAGLFVVLVSLGGSATLAAAATPRRTPSSRALRGKRSHHPRRSSAARLRPLLRLSGHSLKWRALPGVSTYVVAVVQHPFGTRDTTYRWVRGTSFRPSKVPGQTVEYGLRANVPAAPWAREVMITWARRTRRFSAHRALSSSGSSMVVGLNETGWVGGVGAIKDLARAFQYVRVDASRPEPISDYTRNGVKAIVTIPGTCPSCGYSLAGVRTINAAAWASSALSYYHNQCKDSAANCPALELLNEPAGYWFWGGGATSQANEAAYANLIRTTWDTFHNRYGSNGPKILATYENSDWWAGVRASNSSIGKYFDGIVVHAYGGGCGSSRASSALGMRSLVSSAHTATRKPVWITEVGWPTATSQPCNSDSLQWTETQQADNIYNFVTWARSTGYVSAVMYFQYRDYTGMWYGVERYGEGGSTVDGSKKPGWYALAEAARNQSCTVC
jgi:Glycosyl hydrolase catalytic core